MNVVSSRENLFASRVVGHPRPSDRGTKGDGAGAASLGWQDRIRPISYVERSPPPPKSGTSAILTPTPTAFWPIDGHRHRAVGRSARVSATPFSLRPHARRDTHTALTPMMMRAPEEYAKQKSRRPSPRSQWPSLRLLTSEGQEPCTQEQPSAASAEACSRVLEASYC